MARDIAGGISDEITVSASAITLSVPYSICAWVNADLLLTQYRGIINESGSQGLYVQTAKLNWYDGGNHLAATTLSTGVWYHVGFVGKTSSSKIYLNGAVDLSNGTTPNALTVNKLGRGGNGETWNGKIAEVGCWDAELDIDEMASLAKGLAPLCVRPVSLQRYWPLWGRDSPEVELIANNTGSLVNASTADHPRIIYPGRKRIFLPPAAAPATGNPKSVMRGIMLAGPMRRVVL